MVDELEPYLKEKSIRGDLARELQGILDDYKEGVISASEKEELVEEVFATLEANKKAKDEATRNWAAKVIKLAIKVV